MTLPLDDEHPTSSDGDDQHRAPLVEQSPSARTLNEMALQAFGAAVQRAESAKRWFATDVNGTGPASNWLSKAAANYNKVTSQLVEPLPPNLEGALRQNIGSNEVILIKLKGGYKEALICTDQKVYIIKSGFMTGNTFGTNVFQTPLTNVDSVDVQSGGLSWQGRFELLVRGGTTAVRSQLDASHAKNCVSLYGPGQAQRFRKAGSFILERRATLLSPAASAQHDSSPAESSIVSLLERLADLHGKGLLTREEFESQKRSLLGTA